MGEFFSPSNFNTSHSGQQGSNTSQSAPWAAQQPYLAQGFQTAGNLLSKDQSTPFYSGELYANLNPGQLGALSGLNNYATSGGANTAGSLTSVGGSALPGVATAANNYNTIFGQTQKDPTSQIINDAGQYANNPYTQGMITAAQRPIEQQLNESSLIGNDQNATGTGNTDSSRAGVAEAILRRNAGNQESDVASNILGNQYNSGINTAGGLYGTNLSGALSATGGSLNTGSTGANLLSQGYQTTLNNLNIPLQTGSIQQQNQQGADTSAYNAWQAKQQYPWQSLDNFMGVVGNPSYGSTSSGTQNVAAQNTPSTMQTMTNLIGVLSDPRAKVVMGEGDDYPDLMGQLVAQGNKSGSVGGGFLGKGALLSDPRMKVSDGNTHGALGALDQINIKKARYKFDPPGTARPMMMAPQVQKVLPNAVTGRPNGPQLQTIKMGEMMPVLVGAIKELHQKVKNDG